MPELRRNFTSGRMNKDLDERLVPNGEYRDALNISVSTSSSSDKGSVESVKGNSRISTLGITGQKCIGSVRDEKTNKIYWFISGNAIDAIAEYDEDTNQVQPVLVDVFQDTAVVSSHSGGANTITLAAENVNIKIGMTISGTNVPANTTVASISGTTLTLSGSGSDYSSVISGTLTFVADKVFKFSSTSIITGVNILDGIIYFTDNINEPKQVDIVKCKNGSTNFSTHTKLKIKNIDKGNITEEHIALIKKSPLNAPSITMSNSLRGGVISSTFSSAANFFGDSNGSKAPGTELANITFSPKPNFEVGDNLKFTHSAVEDGEVVLYEVRVVLTTLVSETAVAKVFKSKILSITEDVITTATIQWDVALEQKDPFFELVFPRFAYRWKYANGQYSAFSPFSEVAFLPDEVNGYKFDSKNGFNLSMANTIRKITLGTFDTKPSDVVEVDILFKQSNNTNVYTVKSLKNNETAFDITSEQIYATVPSNQIIRPYDNVPKKALAQDVVANRLVFGNYTQNYNVLEVPEFQTNVLSSKISNNTPTKSLKSIRKYQLGVIFLDEFGRHTPVFADDSGVVTIDQIQSNTANKIESKITTKAPDWATHYRYYVKEISNEFYNLPMDRYYEAEDGNVWLSFPSADRNKVDLETFLILKKKHTENGSVFNTSGGTVKYKILDISNEAPLFIKQKKTTLGKITTTFGTNADAANGFPEKGFLSFKLKGSEINTFKDLNTTSVSDKYIRISTSSNSSELYQLTSINVTDGNTDGDNVDPGDTWTFNIAEAFGDDISFVGTGTNKTSGLSLEVLKEEVDENNPEFVGKFFVKIPRDSILDANILSKSVDSVYKVKNAQNIHKIDTQHNSKADYSGTQLYAIDKAAGFDENKNTLATGIGARRGKKNIHIRLIEIGPDKEPHTLFPNIVNLTANATLDGQLRTPGTLLRWRDDPSQEVYEIVSASAIKVFNHGTGPIKRKKSDNKGIRYKITLDKALNFNAEQVASSGVTADSGSTTVLEVVSEVINESTFTSDSPAVFETEPKQATDLDLYYETSKTYAIADLAVTKTLDYFNCFSFGNGVESNRIRDDFNAPTIDKGVRVSTVLAEQYKEEHKPSGLIYSGIYNSTSSINRLNQFIAGEKITKDLNPEYGSIQKLHTRNTDLIALCEDKVLKILANKDALFNADGNVNVTSTNNVLGQAMPFGGEFGISKNPESFTYYGYRSYFADKARGAVLRLSMDGITKISDYGMSNYFKDNLAVATTILGSYDEDGGNYNITLNNDTVSFAESINGWESRKSFIPESGISLNKTYYTFNAGDMWKHTDTATRNTFYGNAFVDSQITLLLNDVPSSVKKYKTINYEGSSSRIYNSSGSQTTAGWYVNNITTDQQSGEIKQFKDKENKWYNYIKGKATTGINIDTKEFNIQGVGKLSSISAGDQTLFDVNITVNGLTAKNMLLTSVSGPGTWTLSGNTVTRTGVSTLDSIEPVELTFTCEDGFVNPTSQTLASQSPSSFNAISYNTLTTTTNKLGLSFSSGTLSANKNITVTLNSAAIAETFTIAGTFDVDVANTTGSSSTNNAYTGSAVINGNISNFIDQTFTASTDHYFFDEPKIEFADVDYEDNYDIVITDTNDGSGNLTARRFQVSYNVNEKENISSEKINFIARAINNQASTGKLYNFTCDDTTLDYFGDERTIGVYGDPGATYKLSISDGSNTYDFTTNTFTSSSTESSTLTIGTQGSSLTTIDFPTVTANKTYTTTITAVGGGVSWNTGNATTRTFPIDQKKSITISFNLTNANTIDTASGETVTPTSITTTSTSGDTSAVRLPLSYTITTTNDMVLLSTPQYNSWSGSSVNNTTREITLANGSKVTIDKHLVSIDNTVTPNEATYVANALISEFGTDNDVVSLNIGNHLNAQSNSNQFVNLGVTVASNSAGETNLTAVSLTSGSQVLSSATVATGTGKVTGDFSGQSIYDITINVQSITDSSQITGFGLSTSTSNLVQTAQPTSLTQISSNVWEATFNWAATLNSGNTAANNTYNVAISVDLNATP